MQRSRFDRVVVGIGGNGDATTHLAIDLHRQFDLIIDPGTTEHCFNIAQAMKNIAEMTKVGGLIFHQIPGAYLNHGFYSVSPTFFLDFYSKNGFLVLKLDLARMKPGDKAVKPLDRVDFIDMMNFDTPKELPGYPLILHAIVMKQQTAQIRWPIQRIYGGP